MAAVEKFAAQVSMWYTGLGSLGTKVVIVARVVISARGNAFLSSQRAEVVEVSINFMERGA
jgi:hypothetical protein